MGGESRPTCRHSSSESCPSRFKAEATPRQAEVRACSTGW